MSDLLERMTMDMELRNFSPKTIDSYSYHVRKFLAYYNQKAEELDEDDIRKYLYMLKKERKLGQSNLTQAFSAIKFLYRSTLKMPMTLSKLRGPGRVQKLPVVLSKQELTKLFEATTNLKHKTILMTTYAAGLRGSEAAQLKVSNIDSQRMQIRVQQGKGSKDRYTLLSGVLLKQLRTYWIEYKPQTWLFPSRDKTKPISASTILQIFKSSKKKAGILKPAVVHTLRHSFATHLLEQGASIFTIQLLLGHKHIQSTMIYLHIQHHLQLPVISPLDTFDELSK